MAQASADNYFSEATEWRAEIARLRELLLSSGLQEAIKWGSPCYSHDGKNVVGLAVFKSYFGLWFFQGALLRDEGNVLVNAQQGKTRAMRQWRMNAAKDIKVSLIRGYLREAMQLAEEGRAIKPMRHVPLALPAVLEKALNGNPKAKSAFATLRPGLQREYAEFISSAKRQDTTERRLQKILPLIAQGIGLNDRYR